MNTFLLPLNISTLKSKYFRNNEHKSQLTTKEFRNTNYIPIIETFIYNGEEIDVCYINCFISFYIKNVGYLLIFHTFTMTPL